MDDNNIVEVKVINSQPLDIETYKMQNAKKKDLLHYLALDCEPIDIENNYKEIILKMTHNGNEYTFIHGFPGDEPVGCILLEDDSFMKLDIDDSVNIDKMDRNDDLKLIQIWYEQITESQCNYVDEFWY